MTDFNHKTIFITGAAMGIGYLLTKELTKHASTLILLDINAEQLQKVKDELATVNNHIDTYLCDLSSRENIESVCQTILAKHPQIDIVINNAGIISGERFHEVEIDAIEKTFAVNSLAPIIITRLLLPQMIARNEGHLVTVASAAGIIGSSKMVDYSASKFAAFGFDDALRAELKSQNSNIQTTVVCPYYISTGMFEGVKTYFSLLLPILKPEYVTTRILHAIKHNKRRLIMPRFVYTTFIARVLPVSWFDGIMKLFGINRCMDTFVGRNK